MRRANALGCAFLVAAAAAQGASSAAAPPAPAATAVATAAATEDLDGDGAKERVTLESSGALRVVDAAGATWATATLTPPPEAESPSLEVVREANGGRVYLHARIAARAPHGAEREPAGAAGTGSDGKAGEAARTIEGAARAVEWVGLVEKRTLRPVYAGATGPQGRDGEWAARLRVDPRGVLRYQTSAGVARCDGDGVLFPELYDADAGRFRPVNIAPPIPADAPILRAVDGAARPAAPTATAGDPRTADPPSLRLFHFTAASAERDDERRADHLTPPAELEDGRRDTAWVPWTIGQPGTGQGAFVTSRAVAPGLSVAGVRVEPGAGRRLRSLLLLLSGGAAKRDDRWWRVELGDGAARPLYIPLPAAQPAACVTLMIDRVDTDGGDRVAVAEASIVVAGEATTGAAGIPVTAQSSVARPGATGETAGARLAWMVRSIEDGVAGADGLAQSLSSLGAPAVSAIAEALPGSTGEGRRRLVRALIAGRSAEAAAILVAELATASPEEGTLIEGALAEPGALLDAAIDPLLRLAGDRTMPDGARACAVRLAGRHQGGRRVPELWALVAASPRSDPALAHPLLAEAIARAVAQGPTDLLLPLVAAAAADAACAARVEAVRALGELAARAHAAGRAALAPVEVEALRSAFSSGAGFELRYAVLRALALSPDPRLRPLLDEGARDPDEVLRFAAVGAAAAFGAAGHAVLLAAVGDADPRVRAAALSGLAAGDPALAASAAVALGNDRWPSVRRVAAERLAAACPGAAGPALERALSDHDPSVRAASLDSLSRCDPARASPLLLQLLRNQEAAPSLRETAAARLVALHPPGTASAIARALDELLTDPSADERQAGLAVSMTRALGRLRDPEGQGALLRVSEPGENAGLDPAAATALRSAAVEALGALCTAESMRAVEAATRDADPAVRRAAQLSRCPPAHP